jgi:hypothetical protein
VPTSAIMNASGAVVVLSTMVWLAMLVMVGAPSTVDEAVSLLSAGVRSSVALAMVAVFVTSVPPTADPDTASVSVNAAFPLLHDAMVHETRPLAPTAGVVHDQPPGEASETKVVPAGSASDSDTAAATAGPLLVAVMVYITCWPAITGSGTAVIVRLSSATSNADAAK